MLPRAGNDQQLGSRVKCMKMTEKKWGGKKVLFSREALGFNSLDLHVLQTHAALHTELLLVASRHFSNNNIVMTANPSEASSPL